MEHFVIEVAQGVILAHGEYLLFLLAIPLFIIIYVIHRHFRKKALKRYGDLKTLEKLTPMNSRHRDKIKLALWLIGYLFLIIGLARPQVGAEVTESKRKGIEIIIALDVSNSMLAQDLYPTRLENAKRAISRLVDRLKNDRIGLIVFAGDAFVQLPVTSDFVSAKLFLQNINTNSVPRQGTDIAKALMLAIQQYSDNSGKSRALVIISDGEDHEQDPLPFIEEAAKNGIKVFTIGVGSPEGSPIKLQDGTMLTDNTGTIVVTKLDESMLQNIATQGGGSYVRATNANFGLNDIVNAVRNIEQTELSGVVFDNFKDKYLYFFIVALICFVLDIMFLETKHPLWRFLSV